MTIKILHAHNFGHKNIGDDAMAENVFRKLSAIPGAQVTTISTYEPPYGSKNNIKSLSGVVNNYNFFLLKIFLVIVHRLKLKPIYVVYAWLCCEMSFWVARIYKKSGVCLLFWGNTRKLIKAISGADMYVRSGSGSLNDIWFWSSMYPQFTEARISHLFGLRVYFTGQGIGPLSTAYRRRCLAKFAQVCTLLTYRDVSESERLVSSLVNGVVRHETVGDDAFDYPKESLPREIEELFSGQKRVLICQFRPTNYESILSEEYWRKVAGALESFAEQDPLNEVVLVSFSNGRVNDLEIAKKINEYANNKLIIFNQVFSPGEAKMLLSKAYAVIGQSYHFAVFSLSENVPTIALYTNQYYKDKHEGLLNWYGLARYALSQSKIVQLSDYIDKLNKERDEIIVELKKVNAKFRKSINKVFSEIER